MVGEKVYFDGCCSHAQVIGVKCGLLQEFPFPGAFQVPLPALQFFQNHGSGADIVVDGCLYQCFSLSLRREAVDVFNFMLREFGVRGRDGSAGSREVVPAQDHLNHCLERAGFRRKGQQPGKQHQQQHCAEHFGIHQGLIIMGVGHDKKLLW